MPSAERLCDEDDCSRYVVDRAYESGSNRSIPDEDSYSDDGILDGTDDASSHTMSTLQSREAANYFRDVFGFTFSADQNVPLIWPVDATADRLDVLLHLIVRICCGGRNLSNEADAMLRMGGIDRGGARVLDMLTNSGTWVNEMASLYSTARFTSLDTKPLVPHKPHPRIDYQVYECYAGIMEPDNVFDLVHLREGVYATKDFSFLLREVHRVLKPGGHLLITEIPAQMFEGPTNAPVPLHSAPYMVQGTKLVHDTCQAEGVDVNIWHDMIAMLEPSHSLWSVGSKLTPGASPPARGFRDVSLHTHPCPIGPWAKDENQRVLGSLTRLWSIHHARAALPMVMLKGEDEAQGTAFVEKIVEEMMDNEKYKAYLMCHTWSARKI